METEVVKYIKEAQNHGLSDIEIKQNLLNAGWAAEAVESGFAHVRSDMAKPAENADEDIRTTKPADAALAAKPAQTASSTPPMQQPAATASTPYSSSTSAVSAVSISEQHFQNPPGNSAPFYKKPLLWIILIALIVVGGGAGAFYVYGFSTPTKAWKNFVNSDKGKVYQNKFKLIYSDSGSYEEGGLELKDIKVAFDGDFYVNAQDPNNPESSSNVKYELSSGNTGFKTGFEYMLLNKNLFVKIDENPLLGNIFSAMADGKKYVWLKVDFNAIENAMAESGDPDSELFKELLTPSLKEELAKIWEDATFVKVEKYMGREKVGDTNTYHFKNSLDKQAVKDVFDKYLTKLDGIFKEKDSSYKPEEMQLAKDFIAALVDKIEIKEFETWIGTRDFRLYRVHFVSNAPSVVSIAKNFSGETFLGNTDNKDSKRLADIRQLASALELYFNDNNGYPGGSNGIPADITPNYIGMVPQAPEASGKCSEYYNTYWYTPGGTKSVFNGKTVYSSYEYTFCLGGDAGGYPGGLAKLTPMGIQGNLPCAGTEEQCLGVGLEEKPKTDKEKMQEIVSKIDFAGEIRADVDYSNYGEVKSLQAPGEYFDVLNMLADARAKSRDAKRLADIRQLASALELYFNDHNSYPARLEDAAPTYIGIIPQAPEVQDGTCSAEDNRYSYSWYSNGDYRLTFCLGANTGGYSAGKHSLTPRGIE